MTTSRLDDRRTRAAIATFDLIETEVRPHLAAADGNGRSSRLLADLVFVAAQDSDTPDVYDWRLDKRRYIDLLRRYDRHRDPRELADFLGTQPLDS